MLYHLTVLVHAKAKIHLGVVGKRWIFTISTTSHLIGKCLLNIDYDHKKGLDFLNYLILLVCLHAIKNIIYIVNVAG